MTEPEKIEPLLPPSREVQVHAVKVALRGAVKAIRNLAATMKAAFARLAAGLRKTFESLETLRPMLRRMQVEAIRKGYVDRRRVERTIRNSEHFRNLDRWLDEWYSPA
jgi:hypothetical protein